MKYLLILAAIAVLLHCSNAANTKKSDTVQIKNVGAMEDISYNYVVENDLHIADQTHEVVVHLDQILITQMSNSVLLKAEVDQKGVIKRMVAFQIGRKTSMLHGIVKSKKFPGMVWVTLEADNTLLLIDPVRNTKSTPIIKQVIRLPEPAKGPHYIGEYGKELWITNKRSDSVMRINYEDTSVFQIYKGREHPVFVGQHPVNKCFYSGQDVSNLIMKIDPKTDKVTQIPVTSTGTTPVGLISGPKGIYFVLAGNSTHGTGTFGCIYEDDRIVYFKLKSLPNAALLHLAFDDDYLTNRTLFLLSTSLINKNISDALIVVIFDSKWKTIVSERVILIPTLHAKVHRIAVTKDFVLVTELATSKLASFAIDRIN